MEKEPTIIGRGSIEEKNNLKNVINKAQESGLEPFEDEIEKSERLILFIDFINDILRKEFNFLRIGNDWKDINYGQVHLLHSEKFEKKFNRRDTGGACNRVANYVIITTKIKEEYDIFQKLFHELLHALAKKSFGVNKEGSFYTSRHGLAVDKIVGAEMKDFFGPLDEGFVDFLMEYFINKYRDELSVKLKFEDTQSYHDTYPTISIVENIIKKISERNKISNDEAVSFLERIYFTRNLLPFYKEITKCYGEKALDVLKKISSEDYSRGYSNEFHLFCDYFDESADMVKRKEIEDKLGI